MQVPLVIAHRGDSSSCLENSLEAVHRALSVPVDMIELDIRKSSDGVLYVMHDRHTGRTADQNLDIEHAESAALASIRLRNGEPIPTLRDALKTVAGSSGLNLEIKSDGAGLLTAEFLASSDYRGYVLVSSFKADEVAVVRKVLPSLPTSIIYDVLTAHDIPRYASEGFRIISLRKNAVSGKLLSACKDAGIDVYVWTVDDEAEMKKFIDMGVGGIYSNKPALLKKVVSEYQNP